MLTGFDHIVLCVADPRASVDFYQRAVGMEGRRDGAGKYALHFGTAKISLQQPDTIPDIAKGTLPGTANFCVVSDGDIADIAKRLQRCDVKIIQGPGPKTGALGPMQSVYFHDPDGNLVEVCCYGQADTSQTSKPHI